MKHIPQIVGGLYFIVTSVAAMAGRKFGVRWLYDWGDSVGMAYATATQFLLLGILLVIIGLINRRTKGQ